MAKRMHNQLRIIGGDWKGQRLRFDGVPGLRPTSDRNRETLFNWLQPVLPGSHCLDLFAGSGALGLEAISRGAASALLVERDRRALASLRANIKRLGADDRVRLHGGDALRFLAEPKRPYDIVFLDPPFSSDLVEPVCRALAAGDWVTDGGHIYVEHARQQQPAFPAHWRILRERTAGDVRFLLLQPPGN